MTSSQKIAARSSKSAARASFNIKQLMMAANNEEMSGHKSKGEEIVELTLDNLGISYIHDREMQDCFQDLPSILKTRRMDFIVLDKTPFAIEVDGSQHSPNWKGIADRLLKKPIENPFQEDPDAWMMDMFKQNECIRRGIPVLRIRFDQIYKTQEMIKDIRKNPKKYLTVHNTYLSNSEYWGDDSVDEYHWH